MSLAAALIDLRIGYVDGILGVMKSLFRKVAKK